MMITSFDGHATILETLIRAARARGIRISILLVDRVFNGTGVVNKLRQRRQRFLMPAQMHKNVKRAFDDYDKGLCLAAVDYTVKADDKVASYRLFMVKKKDALPI